MAEAGNNLTFRNIHPMQSRDETLPHRNKLILCEKVRLRGTI